MRDHTGSGQCDAERLDLASLTCPKTAGPQSWMSHTHGRGTSHAKRQSTPADGIFSHPKPGSLIDKL